MVANARLRPFNPDQKLYSGNGIEVVVSQDLSSVLDPAGAETTTNPDGSIVVDFNPPKNKGTRYDKSFYKNLAEEIDDGILETIASELLQDIEGDIRTRQEWMDIRKRGIELLGYKLEDPRGDFGGASAPLEGMSTVRHPLLSEAVLRFQANARGELLPAGGPVKVRNFTPPPPEGAQGYQAAEDLSTAMEIDFNYYLTVTAKEYYPDTDRMLFQVGFGGLGIKKVYNCPIRRRPVSESVDPADLIVSNSATDLQSSGRITHRIKMRPSVLKRMQLVKAYRKVLINYGLTPQLPTPVEKEVGEVQGIKPQSPIQRPEDQDQEIYETYCELDIPGYEHEEDGEETGLRLPYKVSIHVPSKQILEIRRNWLKDDPMYMPREYFVDYQFVPAFGFYPLGLVHILGNTVITLTAAWRETIDCGMFSNFPGFIYAKGAGRQLSNQFRVPPGGGIGLDTGGNPIRDSIMPLPYKDVSGAFATFIQHVEEYGMRLGSVSETTVGEGKQEAPVGTTLALIEQATKLMDAVHKRLHAAQAKEFQLLKERFKEDPEAFWRFNKTPAYNWQKKQFVEALDNNNVVPVADPNNPTTLHRIAKAMAIKQLQAANGRLYDPMAVDKRIFRMVGVDPEGLFLPQEAPPPPDPRMVAIEQKAKAEQLRSQMQALQAQIKAATSAQTSYDKAADRQSQERIQQMKIQVEAIKAQLQGMAEEKKANQEMALRGAEHQQEMQMEGQKHQQKMQHEKEKAAIDIQLRQQEMAMKAHETQAQMAMQREQSQMELQGKAHEIQANAQLKSMQVEQQSRLMEQQGVDKGYQGHEAHEAKLRQADEAHQQKMRQSDEAHKAKVQQTKELAKAKPTSKPKK